MSNKKRLIIFILLFPFISLFVYGLLSYLLLFFNSKKEIKNELTHYEQNLMNLEKNRLKEKVEYLVNFINYYDGRSSKKIKDDVKKVVDTSVQVANNLYHDYKDKLPKKELQKLITNSLKGIKFEGNLGYLFVLDLKGDVYVHIDPKMVGTNIFDIKDVNGKYILHEFNKVLKKSGEGYVDYYWYIVSEDRKRMHYKISYVKMLDCYDWYVGGGEYLKYMKKFVKEDILDYIRANAKFKNGYFYIYDSQKNVIFKPQSISDIELPKVVGGFNISSKNIIYTKYFKEYDWYISASEDLREIKKTIAEKKDIQEKKIGKQKELNLYLLLFSWFVSIVLSLYLSYILNDVFKKYEKELANSNDKLIFQSRQALIGELFSMIAHQWRQPINKVASIIALLRFSNHDKELDKKYVDIEDNLNFMSETIDDFKTFYMPNEDISKVNLKQVVEKSIKFFENNLQKNSILLKTNLEDITYKTYQNEILQIMMNLIKNSIDSLIKSQKSHKVIYIELCKDENKIILTVEDNGVGIKEEDRDRVFEPYFSTKKGSMGLGLYMTKMIIEKHLNGTITYKNLKNGIKFSIILPLQK